MLALSLHLIIQHIAILTSGLSLFRKLAKSLEITAGAAISGWDQSAKVDASYLNRSEVRIAELKLKVSHLAWRTDYRNSKV